MTCIGAIYGKKKNWFKKKIDAQLWNCIDWIVKISWKCILHHFHNFDKFQARLKKNTYPILWKWALQVQKCNMNIFGGNHRQVYSYHLHNRALYYLLFVCSLPKYARWCKKIYFWSPSKFWFEKKNDIPLKIYFHSNFYRLKSIKVFFFKSKLPFIKKFGWIEKLPLVTEMHFI